MSQMTKVECFVVGQESRSIAAVDKSFHRFLITNTPKPPSNRRLQLTAFGARDRRYFESRFRLDRRLVLSMRRN